MATVKTHTTSPNDRALTKPGEGGTPDDSRRAPRGEQTTVDRTNETHPEDVSDVAA